MQFCEIDLLKYCNKKFLMKKSFKIPKELEHL